MLPPQSPQRPAPQLAARVQGAHDSWPFHSAARAQDERCEGPERPSQPWSAPSETGRPVVAAAAEAPERRRERAPLRQLGLP